MKLPSNLLSHCHITFRTPVAKAPALTERIEALILQDTSGMLKNDHPGMSLVAAKELLGKLRGQAQRSIRSYLFPIKRPNQPLKPPKDFQTPYGEYVIFLFENTFRQIAHIHDYVAKKPFPGVPEDKIALFRKNLNLFSDVMGKSGAEVEKLPSVITRNPYADWWGLINDIYRYCTPDAPPSGWFMGPEESQLIDRFNSAASEKRYMGDTVLGVDLDNTQAGIDPPSSVQIHKSRIVRPILDRAGQIAQIVFIPEDGSSRRLLQLSRPIRPGVFSPLKELLRGSVLRHGSRALYILKEDPYGGISLRNPEIEKGWNQLNTDWGGDEVLGFKWLDPKP